jgi:hypothetical protein
MHHCPSCHCASRAQEGPLPILLRAVWRLCCWLAQATWSVLTGFEHWLADCRAGDGPVVLAQVSHPKRALLLERSLRRAAMRHARAFDFRLPEQLLVLVSETVDHFGEHPSLLEQEQRPDGSTRYLLHLALAPQDRPLGVEALAAELGRQLLQLQRLVEGSSAVVLAGAPSAPPGALVASPFAEVRAHQVVPQHTRNGHHIDGRSMPDPA